MTILDNLDQPQAPARKARRTGFIGNPRRTSQADALTEGQYDALYAAARHRPERLVIVCLQEFGCTPSELSTDAASALLAWYEKENANGNPDKR